MRTQRSVSPLVRLVSVVAFASLLACGGSKDSQTQAPATTTPAKPLRPVVGVLEDQSQVLGGTRAPVAPTAVTEFAPNYIIRLASRWPIKRSGTTLSVCFIGGTAALRTRILTVASEWSQYGRVDFNGGGDPPRSCAANDTSTNIRIGFSQAGYWSIVGSTPTANAQTMNFQGFDAAETDLVEFKTTVLHEFGHALGFEHEHQHPDGGCDDEFDWDTVYPTLEAPPNSWSKTKIDFNLRAFKDATAYGLSPVDRSSIMHYTLPAWMFKDGQKSKCWVKQVLDLSALDQAGAAKYYPTQYTNTDANNQAKELEAVAKSLPPRGAEAKQFIQSLAARIRSMQ